MTLSVVVAMAVHKLLRLPKKRELLKRALSFYADFSLAFTEVINVKKLKINFWHWFFYFGTFLEHLGDQMGGKGLDKLDDLTRDDPDAYMYQKKRGWVR